MTASTPDLCRITVVTPNRWADVALPAGEPLAELLPTLHDHIGDEALDGRQLVLQRLGDEPFDEDRSLVGNDVLDGETLYLNATDDVLPTLDFDDAIAGLGVGVESLGNRWQPVHTRQLLLAAAHVPLVIALAVLVAGRPGGLMAALVAAAAFAGLVTFSALASRAWGDLTLALMLGWSALPFAVVAAGMAAVALGTGSPVSSATGVVAGAALFCSAVAADRAVAGPVSGFAGAAFAGLLTALGCVVGVLAGWPHVDTVAVVLVLAVISTDLAVHAACRVAGVFLPPLPRTAEELEDGIEPVPAQDALTRAAQVDQYLTALLWGAATVIAPCAVVVATTGGWGALLVGVVSASALLRMRVFYGAGQRAALLVAGVAGPATLIVALGLAGVPGMTWVTVGCLATAGMLFAGAVSLPGRRTVPHVGRAAEIAEWFTAAALLPLLLAVLGTYAAARNLR